MEGARFRRFFYCATWSWILLERRQAIAGAVAGVALVIYGALGLAGVGYGGFFDCFLAIWAWYTSYSLYQYVKFGKVQEHPLFQRRVICATHVTDHA